MSMRIKFLLVIALLCAAIIGSYAIGKYLSPAENVFCPSTMADIIQSAKGNVYEIDESSYIAPDSYYLVEYSVNGNEITNSILESVPDDLKDEQRDSTSQNEAWQLFTDMIPLQNRLMLAQYNVFTDGYSETLAAVDQVKENPRQWVLEIDIADLQDKDALRFTLIHEYGHILTLNAEQADTDQSIVDDPMNASLQIEKAAICADYFTGMGCSHADSYINAFYNRFWLDITPEWKKVDALQYADDLNSYYAGLYGFYLAHQDQFVDDYSTTHPTEDIAESFTYFVFSPKPTGSMIRDQKILFFYEYPELVALRQSILKGACSAIK